MNKLFVKTMVAAFILVAAMGFSTNTASAQFRIGRNIFHPRPTPRVTSTRITPVIYYKASRPTVRTVQLKNETMNSATQMRRSHRTVPVNMGITDTTARRYQQQNPVRFGMSKASLPQLYRSSDDEVEPSRDTVCIKNDY